MKKRILLFTTSIVFTAGAIMSNNAGPANPGGQNRTGTLGAGTATCASGCHTGGSYTNGTPNFALLDGANIVTSWEPGHTYSVAVNGTSSAPKYGYQLTAAWYNGSTYLPQGTFTAVTTTNSHVASLGGYSILEHSMAITVAGNNYMIAGSWTAPASVSTVDTISFHFTINNVDGTGNQTGDNSNNYVFKYFKNTTSVKELSAKIKLNAYPNPMTDKLNISMEGADKGQYTINVFDVAGKVVSTQDVNINGSYNTTINTSAWASGMYHVQVKQGAAQKVIAVMK